MIARMTIAWLNVSLKGTLRAEEEGVILGSNGKTLFWSFGGLPKSCSSSSMDDNSFGSIISDGTNSIGVGHCALYCHLVNIRYILGAIQNSNSNKVNPFENKRH